MTVPWSPLCASFPQLLRSQSLEAFGFVLEGVVARSAICAAVLRYGLGLRGAGLDRARQARGLAPRRCFVAAVSGSAARLPCTSGVSSR